MIGMITYFRRMQEQPISASTSMHHMDGSALPAEDWPRLVEMLEVAERRYGVAACVVLE